MPRKHASARPPRPTGHRAVASGHTRDDILIAAARVMGRRGFGSVSMQEIAAEVGFSAPALYGYFASKEEIFAELGRTLERELAETFAPPPPRLSFRGRVACLVRRQLEWSDRRRDVFLAFMAAHCRGEGQPQKGDHHGPGAYLARLSVWLRDAAADPADPGDPGDHDPDEIACVLMGISHGYFLRWVLADCDGRLADQTERIVETFFHGIAGPPAPIRRPTRAVRRRPPPRRT